MTALLIGHPNCGKSSLFNLLTNQNSNVGNWAGVTVSAVKGDCFCGNTKIEVIDLPGCYDLYPSGNLENQAHENPAHEDLSFENLALDEQLTLNHLRSNSTDIIINVIDATHLERQLFLTLQLLEQKTPVILVLNMMDMTQKEGIEINVSALEEKLGCKVIPISALKNTGIESLKNAMRDCICLGTSPKSTLLPKSHHTIQTHYEGIKQILSGVVNRHSSKKNHSAWLDQWLLHRVFGIPIFLGMMYLIFTMTVEMGGFFKDFIETPAYEGLVRFPITALSQFSIPDWILGIIEGIGKGLHITLCFVPILTVLFASLAFLEASGFMTRVAFLTDKVMQSVGLPGKAFVPMILGFGCNVPAVMSARTLEDKRERILTILMTPFMSCGARLAIFSVFVSAFFPSQGGSIIFALYVIGILIALFTAFVLRTTVLGQKQSPLILELPPYRLPSIQWIFRQTVHRLNRFVLKAGALIVLACLLFGYLGSFGKENTLDHPFVSVAKKMSAVFAPMGIEEENWPATVGLMSGIIAKEVVVGTLNSLYGSFSVSSDSSASSAADAALVPEAKQQMVSHFNNGYAAFAYLLFVLLYFPCVSVVATMARELNKKWAFFSVAWSTGLAYGVAVLFYQSATFSLHPGSSLIWIFSIVGMGTLGYLGMRKWGQAHAPKKVHKQLPTKIQLVTS